MDVELFNADFPCGGRSMGLHLSSREPTVGIDYYEIDPRA
jgi:hypothetical protein